MNQAKMGAWTTKCTLKGLSLDWGKSRNLVTHCQTVGILGWKGFSLVALLVTGAVLPVPAYGQERPGRLSKEVRKTLVPGLLTQFMDDQNGGQVMDARVDSFCAFCSTENQPKTAFQSGDPTTIKMSGFVKLKLKGTYRFRAKSIGQFELWVNQKPVLKTSSSKLEDSAVAEIDMVKGYNQIQISYRPENKVLSQFRLYWSSDDFYWEPLPPTVLFTSSDETSLKSFHSKRKGREIFATHKCARCHQLPKEIKIDGQSISNPTHMFELVETGPNLDTIKSRLNPEWVMAWVLDPKSIRNSASMPQLLGHLDPLKQKEVAANIVAYLFKEAAEIQKFTREGDLSSDEEKGEIIFEDRGCIACHRFSENSEEDDFDRISLALSNAKFQTGAIASHAINSRLHYEHSKMPRFDLSEGDAKLIETFVRILSESKLPLEGDSLSKGDPVLGAKQFVEFRCVNCHQFSKTNSEKVANDIFSVSKIQGCVANEKKLGQAHYGFSESEQTDLISFLRTGGASLKRTIPTEFANRNLTSLRCASCHRINGEEGALPYVFEEGSRGIQAEEVPPITFAGEKLRGEFLEKQLSGELKYRTREHFKIKMPAFPHRGSELALGLKQRQGFTYSEDKRPRVTKGLGSEKEPDAKLLEAKKNLAAVGAKIAAMENGLACMRCHSIGKEKPIAAFDALSTNLAYASDRLTYEYFNRWMFDPQRVDPRTKMLKFSLDRKKTSFQTAFDGDAKKQFEAIWEYLESIDTINR